ncbi:metal ABC transporter ATP-binding protein [Natranaerofaba carboxydovora]|uniref:metal ABC transporter ATP-binding protein n=1 Tax=Natranaerofaba carboxydovora TaxID=2742683 RepID=UPI001F12E278|nr:metal ABC transporter ATP-binding protein [Natranaerofaba carboxydovora]UMZ74259.1 Fe(3+) dicitrate transport ATP-binding protein FecE [Natranaerofaba carboxydovora]
MTVQTAVEVQDLCVSYYGNRVLDKINLDIPLKQIVGIVGPNGAGKSTLIKAAMGLIPIEEGKVRFFGQPASKSYKRVAYVPQHSDIDHSFPVTVQNVVMMGRYPYLSLMKRPDKKDYEAVNKSLEMVGLVNIKDKQIGELSGGQTQRVFLARALAQDSNLLFLDEPFVGIDITSEEIITGLLKELRNSGKTILVVHHDLSKADNFFDSVVLLNKCVIKYGSSEEVFKPDYLEKAYEGKVTFVSNNNNQSVVVS